MKNSIIHDLRNMNTKNRSLSVHDEREKIVFYEFAYKINSLFFGLVIVLFVGLYLAGVISEFLFHFIVLLLGIYGLLLTVFSLKNYLCLRSFLLYMIEGVCATAAGILGLLGNLFPQITSTDFLYIPLFLSLIFALYFILNYQYQRYSQKLDQDE